MAQYGQILLMAMPVFLLLVLFEKWYGWRKGFETVRSMDMISSLTSGITNVTKDVLGLSFAIVSYQWLLDRIAVTAVQSTFLTYLIAFVALDFAGYLVHTLNHKVNFFWNAHIVHHSSEEYNLACALRQSVSVFVKLFDGTEISIHLPVTESEQYVLGQGVVLESKVKSVMVIG
jgi:sterol desaturase/sphingolipid hydroxylase (fatty acid hydroxylase superfamily)